MKLGMLQAPLAHETQLQLHLDTGYGMCAPEVRCSLTSFMPHEAARSFVADLPVYMEVGMAL